MAEDLSKRKQNYNNSKKKSHSFLKKQKQKVNTNMASHPSEQNSRRLKVTLMFLLGRVPLPHRPNRHTMLYEHGKNC